MRRVIIESPYAGNIRQNLRYARKAVRDSVLRREAPIASHLLFTQRGILRDEVLEERRLGIAAGLAWTDVADVAIFYADLGFSTGMLEALKLYTAKGIPVEVRYLNRRGGTARPNGGQSADPGPSVPSRQSGVVAPPSGITLRNTPPLQQNSQPNEKSS